MPAFGRTTTYYNPAAPAMRETPLPNPYSGEAYKPAAVVKPFQHPPKEKAKIEEEAPKKVETPVPKPSHVK